MGPKSTYTKLHRDNGGLAITISPLVGRKVLIVHYTHYTHCTLYSRYSRYSRYSLYSLYALHPLHPLHSLHSLYPPYALQEVTMVHRDDSDKLYSLQVQNHTLPHAATCSHTCHTLPPHAAMRPHAHDNICTLFVHYLYTIGWFVHYLCIICALFVHFLYTFCTLFVQVDLNAPDINRYPLVAFARVWR
jgi:hypothetical protein